MRFYWILAGWLAEIAHSLAESSHETRLRRLTTVGLSFFFRYIFGSLATGALYSRWLLPFDNIIGHWDKSPPFILATICPVDARSRADCNGMFCMDWTTACILWNLSGVSNRRLVRGAWYFFTEYIYNLWSAVYTPFVGINVDWWFSESAPILVMEHSIWLGGPPTKKRTSLLPQVTPYDGALRAAKRAIIAPPS